MNLKQLAQKELQNYLDDSDICIWSKRKNSRHMQT